MLVLSRKLGEKIVISDNIIIEVIEIRRDRIRLGLMAPEEIVIHRKEVWDEIHKTQTGGDSDAKP